MSRSIRVIPRLPVDEPKPSAYEVLDALAPLLSPNTRFIQAVQEKEQRASEFNEYCARNNIPMKPSSFSSTPYYQGTTLAQHGSVRPDSPNIWTHTTDTRSRQQSESYETSSGNSSSNIQPVTNGPDVYLSGGSFKDQQTMPLGPTLPSDTSEDLGYWPLEVGHTKPTGTWGTSPNYKGNPCLLANQSADIPEHESCSLWITNLNLPRERAEHELLAHVRGCGKIYACVVNGPEATVGHSTSAAKLVFFHVSGARELLRQARAGEFTINGYVPKVVCNRIRTKAREPGPESRVIHIEGPKVLVDEGFLDVWFRCRFNFQTDEVTTLSEDKSGPNGRRRLEWRFASYRCQASSAVQLIDRERRRAFSGLGRYANLWRQVNTFYGVDPCA